MSLSLGESVDLGGTLSAAMSVSLRYNPLEHLSVGSRYVPYCKFNLLMISDDQSDEGLPSHDWDSNELISNTYQKANTKLSLGNQRSRKSGSLRRNLRPRMDI